MSTQKKLTVLFLSLIGATWMYAQDGQTVSDQELEKFASAFQQIQLVTQEAQQEMVAAVEQEGLAVQRFSELMQAAQDPNQETEGSDEEIKKFEAAIQVLDKIQAESQQDMQDKIVDEGLSVDRYQAIAALVQNDTQLQQKVQQFMEKE